MQMIKRNPTVVSADMGTRSVREKHHEVLDLSSVSWVANMYAATQQFDSSAGHVHEPAREDDSQLEKMACAVKTLIECMGEDPNREGLLETPLRYATALLTLTKGYHMNIDHVVNGALFKEDFDGMVVVKDICVSSLCEHHLLLFTGKVSIFRHEVCPISPLYSCTLDTCLLER